MSNFQIRLASKFKTQSPKNSWNPDCNQNWQDDCSKQADIYSNRIRFGKKQNPYKCFIELSIVTRKNFWGIQKNKFLHRHLQMISRLISSHVVSDFRKFNCVWLRRSEKRIDHIARYLYGGINCCVVSLSRCWEN